MHLDIYHVCLCVCVCVREQGWQLTRCVSSCSRRRCLPPPKLYIFFLSPPPSFRSSHSCTPGFRLIRVNFSTTKKCVVPFFSFFLCYDFPFSFFFFLVHGCALAMIRRYPHTLSRSLSRSLARSPSPSHSARRLS